MEEEGTVEPQEQIEAIMDQAEAEAEVSHEDQPVQHESKTQVPLSALQKERKRRQELEIELRLERERQVKSQQPVEEDNSKYESATREDVNLAQEEIIRIVEEKSWIKSNPEKYEKVNEYLPQFLKQRPNLAFAINSASNRYEEAYTLMEALTPKQQQQLKKEAIPKKEAPGSPTSVPKAANLNQAVDVMNMTDSEFTAWRQSQKKRR